MLKGKSRNMKSRNVLKNIRPQITTIQQKDQETLHETFQNQTLRPICKFQNELLLLVFQGYIRKRKGAFHQLSIPKKLDYIDYSIRKDQRFRNLLTGLIIGHFTKEEWGSFQGEEKELSRRIINLVIQRLQSQVEIL